MTETSVLVSNLVLGIDPGASGALALINDGVVSLQKMPETEQEIWNAVGDIKNLFLAQNVAPRCVIENVWAMPKQGVSSSFKFGLGLGLIRMALIGHGFKLAEVLPRKWKTVMGCLNPGAVVFGPTGKVGAKDYTIVRAKAQQLFPTTKIVNWNCEALLIACYGRQLIIEGKL